MKQVTSAIKFDSWKALFPREAVEAFIVIAVPLGILWAPMLVASYKGPGTGHMYSVLPGKDDGLITQGLALENRFFPAKADKAVEIQTGVEFENECKSKGIPTDSSDILFLKADTNTSMIFNQRLFDERLKTLTQEAKKIGGQRLADFAEGYYVYHNSIFPDSPAFSDIKHQLETFQEWLAIYDKVLAGSNDYIATQNDDQDIEIRPSPIMMGGSKIQLDPICVLPRQFVSDHHTPEKQ